LSKGVAGGDDFAFGGDAMRRSKLARIANAVIGRVERASSLDKPSYAAETVIARAAQMAGSPAEKAGNALHGTWYGHPLHPMLVTLPIGAWTFALGSTSWRCLDSWPKACNAALTLP
jgi:hypothetical protein